MADTKSSSEQIMQGVLDVQEQALKVNAGKLIPKSYGRHAGYGQPTGLIKLGELILPPYTETNVTIKLIKIYSPLDSIITLGTLPYFDSPYAPETLAIVGPGSHDIPVNIKVTRAGNSANTLTIAFNPITVHTSYFEIAFTSFAEG